MDSEAFNPETDLGVPETLEQAIAERNAWCNDAMRSLRNTEYYRGQRDAFLRAALTSRAVAKVAAAIIGPGWRRLIEVDSERQGGQ